MESRFTRRMLIGTAGAFSGAALFAACATAAPMAEGEAPADDMGEADSKEMMGPAEVKFWTYQDFLLEGHIGNVLLNEFEEANPNVDAGAHADSHRQWQQREAHYRGGGRRPTGRLLHGPLSGRPALRAGVPLEPERTHQGDVSV